MFKVLSMRVIVFNVFYPPIAFGGATIVAEQTTTLMAGKGDDKYLVVTLDPNHQHRATEFTRYTSIRNSVEVIGVPSPHNMSFEESYRGDQFVPKLDLILEAFKPDVALVHCIQGMGARILERLKEQGIPVALFIHDAWWICERQFMVTRDGVYCHQMPVKPSTCRNCVETLENTVKRSEYLLKCLNMADKLIYPSRFFLDLYIASGAPQLTSTLIKNGVKPPSEVMKVLNRNIGITVRFGFVGGVGPIKGCDLIRSVFENYDRSDYELVCVDNLGNLGKKTEEFYNWDITGKYRIRGSYTQDSIDDFFEEIDVLLFPSQWKESFGLAVREALIRHKWVICTNGGGTIEDIINGVNGRIIPMVKDNKYLLEAVNEAFEIDWSTYRNPNAIGIHTFDAQASELRNLLMDISNQ